MEENTTKKPIKRAEEIQPLSRDHHHNLLLCWKIKTGIAKGVDFSRIKTYADWFYKEHVLPHFKIEEKYLFSVLGKEHKLIKKALAEHRRLSRLFKDTKQIEKSLSLIEEELDAHVRFEERILFNAIQKAATPEQLKLIQEKHTDTKFVENTTDEFWV